MKQIGDSIQWNTKSGVATGIVKAVRLRIRYLVKIDHSEQNVVIEDASQSELQSGAEFMKAVQEMRDAQRRYFDTRDSAVLIESKRLEKKVDAIIDMCQAPKLL